MKKIDEGLKRWIKREFWDEIFSWGDFGEPKETRENAEAELENLTLSLQSHLKKEGYAKLPGKYVVKKGCLVKID